MTNEISVDDPRLTKLVEALAYRIVVERAILDLGHKLKLYLIVTLCGSVLCLSGIFIEELRVSLSLTGVSIAIIGFILSKKYERRIPILVEAHGKMKKLFASFYTENKEFCDNIINLEGDITDVLRDDSVRKELPKTIRRNPDQGRT